MAFQNLNGSNVCKILKCSSVLIKELGKMLYRITQAGGMDDERPLTQIADDIENFTKYTRNV